MHIFNAEGSGTNGRAGSVDNLITILVHGAGLFGPSISIYTICADAFLLELRSRIKECFKREMLLYIGSHGDEKFIYDMNGLAIARSDIMRAITDEVSSHQFLARVEVIWQSCYGNGTLCITQPTSVIVVDDWYSWMNDTIFYCPRLNNYAKKDQGSNVSSKLIRHWYMSGFGSVAIRRYSRSLGIETIGSNLLCAILMLSEERLVNGDVICALHKMCSLRGLCDGNETHAYTIRI